MPRPLHFGSASTVSYTPRSELLHWEGPQASAIDDVRGAADAALAAPIDFPPLRMAVVPGDKVVVALEPAVPRAPALVAAVVEAVMHGGASAADITILQTQDDAEKSLFDPRAELSAACRQQVQLATHHPSARQDLSYLGADEHDQPIYVSRHLFDADVVVPIGCVRLDGALGYGGVRATLYPTFADQAAHERCRAACINGASHGDMNRETPRRSSKRAAGSAAASRGDVSQYEADHVPWLLGVMFALQVVPGPADNVLHIVAGHLENVLERGRELYQQAWAIQVPRRAGLVVAAITGAATQQTWDNLGRAVAAASRVLNDNGVIALCTELSDAPGPGIRTAATAQGLVQAQKRLQKHNPSDLSAAEQWAAALDRSRLYLLSRLDEQQVEELGAAHIATAAEVGRLIERTGSCVLLEGAQYALPSVAEE